MILTNLITDPQCLVEGSSGRERQRSETSEYDDTLQLSVSDSQSGHISSYQGVDLSNVDTVMQQDAAIEAYDKSVEEFYKALQPTQQQERK